MTGEERAIHTRTAIYARVSTDLQEREHTIQGQLEALRKYAQDRGYQIVAEYLDDGYSGATLDRPQLDRLRDALRSGEFDIVLFHSPDRLARKAVYQFIVLEELEKAGIKPEFLNYPVDDSPESRMLLGMQGLFAEYDRAKILERTRRGKLQRAREGALVGGHAPYGYRWIKRNEVRRAHLEIDEYQEAVVRRMYHLLVDENHSTCAIARLLTEEGIPTARGAVQWQPMAVHRILTNPTYKGSYLYRHSDNEHISIPVPPLLDGATWQKAQEQLSENSLRSRRNNKKHSYLLRSLIRCPRCGGAYTGCYQHGSRRYRCNRAHWTVSSTGTRCTPGAIPAQPVEDAVWEAIKGAMQRPEVLASEYTRQLEDSRSPGAWQHQRKQLALAIRRTNAQENRITDAYVHEAMDLDRYKSEMVKLKEHRLGLEKMALEVELNSKQEKSSRFALEQMETFCNRVAHGLDAMNIEERQQLLRLVVERVTVEGERVKVYTVIPADPGDGKLRNARGELVDPYERREKVPLISFPSAKLRVN